MSADRISHFLAARLSVLIFLSFAIMGAWVPVFSLHLNSLGFSPDETAWASAASAIGSLIAPIIWGQVADRWLAMQRCISLCAVTTGAIMWRLAMLQGPPWLVILVCIAVWFFLVPTIGLTTSFIFRQLLHPEREYGPIRMWGTVGWMAASWCLTLWFTWQAKVDLADSMRIGAIAAFIVAIYACTLPHTPPAKPVHAARPWYARVIDAPLSALHLFRIRSFAVYCICMFGFYVTWSFGIQLNPLLLKKLDLDTARLPTYLTIAQSTEVVFLFLLPRLLFRFGSKPVMIAGGLSWILGLSVLSVGEPVWFVLASLGTHGIFICCFLIAGQVFINRQATHSIRASAQGFLSFISGLGMLLGHLLVGWIRDVTSNRYDLAYGIAGAISLGLVALFVIGFSPKVTISPQDSLVPKAEMT